MKILIIDDETRKLKKIRSIIDHEDNLQNVELITSYDLSNAKSLMQKTRYDIVILDLKINENIGDDEANSETAGLDFIDEILEIDSIRTPLEIILLTEYEDLQKEYSGNSKYSAYDFLYFDTTSCEWENVIKNKIKYHLYREESEKVFSDKLEADVAIVCAVDNEMNAVKDAFFDGSQKRITFDNDTNIYYLIKKNIKGAQKIIVVAQQNEMGMVAASILSQSIIYHFSPKYIIMVGIAAGIGGNKNFGDIIAATEVWNYSSGKYFKKDGKTEFSPDPKKIPVDTIVEQILRNDYDDILNRIKRSWRSSDKPADLKILLGSLACGAAVVGSDEIVDERIMQHARKTVGLDMESYGLFYSVRYGIGSDAKAICIKAISDFADNDKSDKYQAYAAYTSTSFAKYLIENELKL